MLYDIRLAKCQSVLKRLMNILRRILFILILWFIAQGASPQLLIQDDKELSYSNPIDLKIQLDKMHQLKDHEYKWEIEHNYSMNLYDGWDNTTTHFKTDVVPDTFIIRLIDFAMPTSRTTITSKFGPRWGRRHNGLDIKVYTGDTIVSAFDGLVRKVSYESNGYGCFVVIRHHNGLETLYAHLSKHLVRPNQVVKAGDPIGLGGSTGRSTGSHLHFETRFCGIALNPASLFDFKYQDVIDDYYIFRKK